MTAASLFPLLGSLPWCGQKWGSRVFAPHPSWLSSSPSAQSLGGQICRAAFDSSCSLALLSERGIGKEAGQLTLTFGNR